MIAKTNKTIWTLSLALFIASFIASFIAWGCSEEAASGDGGTGGDGDTDGDTDSDTDGDSDGEADSDTEESTVFTPVEGGSIEDCPVYESGHNLDVCTMTYLTDGISAPTAGVEVHPNQAIVYGGELPTELFSAVDAVLLNGGKSGIMRLSADGKALLSVTHLGETVNDLAVSDTSGHIAVSGDFGVAVLNEAGDAIIWTDDIDGSEGAHLDAGTDGTVAVAHSSWVSVYDAQGNELGNFAMGETTAFNDLAVDSANALVFVTGYKQRDVSGYCMGKYKAGYLRAFDYQGNLVWTNYDWSAQEVDAAGQCSDTTGRGLNIGKDGYLYYAATSDGGNTVHQNDPKDLSIAADNVDGDKYQSPWGLSGAKTIAYFAKFEPASGDHIVGSFLLTRLTSDPNAGNSAKVNTIDADAGGNILVGGASACCVPDGTEKTINNTFLSYPDSYLGGSMILVMSPDMTERRTWNSPRGETGGMDNVSDVAIGANGAWVALTTQEGDAGDNEYPADAPMITVDAFFNAPGDDLADTHLTVFRGPQ